MRHTGAMKTHQVSHVAALMGEPARTSMLLALMDGRALTAKELALAGRVSAATASRHLALLLEAGLLHMERQGRHRYHRLASVEVASMIESLMQLASKVPAPAIPRTGPREEALRMARTCYDHLAGRLGVAIADHLVEESAVVLLGDGGVLPGDGLDIALRRLGVALGSGVLRGATTRPLCRPCLDWSERRPHIAGRLGALICAHCTEQGWLLRHTDSRALRFAVPGARKFRDWMGTERWRSVIDG